MGGHLGVFASAVTDRDDPPGLVAVLEPLRQLHLCQVLRLGSNPRFRLLNVGAGEDDHRVMEIGVAPFPATHNAGSMDHGMGQ